MNIYVLGINFHPEPIGISVYTTEMCEYFKKTGHAVTLFTAFPYYPGWHIEDNYRGKLFLKENYKGVVVRRSYVYVPENVTTKTRILHELSFIVSSFINLLLSEKPDVLIVVSPPLGLGLVAYIISRIKNVPLVFHIQDLQPDASVKLGMIKQNKLIKVLYKVERFIYKNADIISVLSKSMKERVILKGIPERKIVVFPNWVDVDFIKPLQGNNKFKEMYSLSDKFIVLYSGNIGVKQGLELILKVADNMKQYKDILFLIVGDGARKKLLVEESKKMNLVSIKFLPPQTKEVLPELLSSADISVVVQKASVTDFVVPSKLLGILASGKCVVVSANKESEASQLIKSADCGLVVEPEDSEGFKNAILELYGSENKRIKYGSNGRDYVGKNFEKNKILGEFEKKLVQLIKN